MTRKNVKKKKGAFGLSILNNSFKIESVNEHEISILNFLLSLWHNLFEPMCLIINRNAWYILENWQCLDLDIIFIHIIKTFFFISSLLSLKLRLIVKVPIWVEYKFFKHCWKINLMLAFLFIINKITFTHVKDAGALY